MQPQPNGTEQTGIADAEEHLRPLSQDEKIQRFKAFRRNRKAKLIDLLQSSRGAPSGRSR
jgi:hypothetical protein